MKILGIETSCDETAASVVEDGKHALSNVIASQIDIHAQYGGVVPEVASRNHLDVITSVIDQSLTDANVQWDDIDAIAVTKGPGLSGALLIGSLAARTLAYSKQKPLYGVNHVLAHIYANYLAQKQPQFPLLALVVSGGHSQLVLFNEHHDYRLLGRTRDDAVGEAFDKVAKIIGLPYPGGPSVSKAAEKGNPDAFKFPKARLDNPYDFSFSGVKTSVLRKAQEITGHDFKFPSHQLAQELSETQVNDIAASFQKTAVETVVDAVARGVDEFAPESVIIGGGVAANNLLRQELDRRIPIDIEFVPREYCTDNAAMIATLAYYVQEEEDDPLALEIQPNLSM